MDENDLNQIERERIRWEEQVLAPALKKLGTGESRSSELSGKPLYTPDDISETDYLTAVNFPGQYPYTRGIYPAMYLGRLWTMRQYAGFGTPKETHERFRYLLEQGQGGLLVAFDLPTQLGYDSDDPRGAEEVGSIGVAVDSLQDMEVIFQGLPLEQASPSLTMNAAANVALAMYLVVAENEGLDHSRITGTTQNDILKEFLARGTYVFPPRPSLRLAVDIIEFCMKHLPRWNFINICGYHMREAGATMVQEVAFAFADAMAYVDACIERGLDIDSFAPRIAFNFTAFHRLFEEAAKFRAARRIWARLMREHYRAKRAESWMFRTGAGSGGSTLTAQQPENNIVRVALQCLAGILGGVQSFHTAAYDEALGIPTERSALLALRTQQTIAYESGVADVIDPLGGSYYVESLTSRMEEEVTKYLAKIESQGGMLTAIESGWAAKEIAEAAWEQQRQVETGQRAVVGVNRFADKAKAAIKIHRPNPASVAEHKARLQRLRQDRDNDRVRRTLAELRSEAQGSGNLMPLIIEAVKAYATIGEICNTLRDVFGEASRYQAF